MMNDKELLNAIRGMVDRDTEALKDAGRNEVWATARDLEDRYSLEHHRPETTVTWHLKEAARRALNVPTVAALPVFVESERLQLFSCVVVGLTARDRQELKADIARRTALALAERNK